jgi:hypothetical protein
VEPAFLSTMTARRNLLDPANVTNALPAASLNSGSAAAWAEVWIRSRADSLSLLHEFAVAYFVLRHGKAFELCVPASLPARSNYWLGAFEAVQVEVRSRWQVHLVLTLGDDVISFGLTSPGKRERY